MTDLVKDVAATNTTSDVRESSTRQERVYRLTDAEYGLIGMALGMLAGGMPGSVTATSAVALARRLKAQRDE